MSNFKLEALTATTASEVGLNHAVLQSLLNFAKAEKNDLIDEAQNTHGWWGNNIVNGVGCRDWTLARAKQTSGTLAKAKRHTELALQWLIDEGIATTIEVIASYEGEKLNRKINITLADDTKHQVKL